MSGYLSVGDGTERVVIGVANPVRVRALQMLASGEIRGEAAETVRKLLQAPSIKWSEWNGLVKAAKLDKVTTRG